MDPPGLFGSGLSNSGPGHISSGFSAGSRGCWGGQASSRAGSACGAVQAGSAPEWHRAPPHGILSDQGQTWPWSLGTIPADLLTAWLQALVFCGFFERWDHFGWVEIRHTEAVRMFL